MAVGNEWAWSSVGVFAETFTGLAAPINGAIFEAALVVLMYMVYKTFPMSSVSILFDLAYEKVFGFFEEILWEEERLWVKNYITLLFFVILFSNMMWFVLELLVPALWPVLAGGLHHQISIPSGDINFNLAMAGIWVLIMLFLQLRHLKFWGFIYEYFPVFGKNMIPYEGKNIFIKVFVKIFDIIISMFLWILEIIGLAAKVISLAFRLFGNMFSGGVLLWLLVAAVSAWSASLIGFEFPLLFPIIVHLQALLVGLIQAFVFPLLIAIFIKVATMHEEA